MDAATKTRMQIRVVLTVFRSEQARKRRAQSHQATNEVGELLRARSVEMLDDAQAELNGTELTHPELVDELNSARDEVNSSREASDQRWFARRSPRMMAFASASVSACQR